MKKVVSLLLGLVLLLNCSLGCADSNVVSILHTSLFEKVNELSKNASSVDLALGTDNAFIEIYGLIPEDSEVWQLCLEDMMLTIVKAFNSGRLGTKKAQAVITGIIPESVYSNKASYHDQMEAIYDYIVFDKLVNYFVMDFDRDGEPIDCELDLDGVKAFVEECIDCGVFTGSWKSFSLSPKVTSLDDFCKKMNVTKELAVAMFFVIESYNVHSDGNSVLLDELIAR